MQLLLHQVQLLPGAACGASRLSINDLAGRAKFLPNNEDFLFRLERKRLFTPVLKK